MPCPNCQAADSEIIPYQAEGVRVCSRCHVTCGTIILEDNEIRNFNDPKTELRNRMGGQRTEYTDTMIRTGGRTTSADTAIANAEERINDYARSLQLSTKLSRLALLIFMDYKRKKNRSLRSRNLNVITACCILLAHQYLTEQEWAQARQALGPQKSGPEPFSFKRSAESMKRYEQLKRELAERVAGHGRGSSGAALDRQLDDIMQVVNIPALESVSKYIPDLLSGCGYSMRVGDAVKRFRDLLAPAERELVPKTYNVQQYVVIITWLVAEQVIANLSEEDRKKIIPLQILSERTGLSENFITTASSAFKVSHSALYGNFFESLAADVRARPKDFVVDEVQDFYGLGGEHGRGRGVLRPAKPRASAGKAQPAAAARSRVSAPGDSNGVSRKA